jgi:hypothetical protein
MYSERINLVISARTVQFARSFWRFVKFFFNLFSTYVAEICACELRGQGCKERESYLVRKELEIGSTKFETNLSFQMFKTKKASFFCVDRNCNDCYNVVVLAKPSAFVLIVTLLFEYMLRRALGKTQGGPSNSPPPLSHLGPLFL